MCACVRVHVKQQKKIKEKEAINLEVGDHGGLEWVAGRGWREERKGESDPILIQNIINNNHHDKKHPAVATASTDCLFFIHHTKAQSFESLAEQTYLSLILSHDWDDSVPLAVLISLESDSGTGS